MDKRKILIIEDEPDIVRGLSDALEFEGFEVDNAATGAEGIRKAREGDPDCVILDLMLPDDNGYNVCERIREFSAVMPVIMLTARSQEADKIRGLESGADDYVTKPFSIGELCARIKALFRRLNRLAGPGVAEEVLRIGSAEIDLKKHVLARGKKSIALTFYEVELLKFLNERLDQPVSRDEILEKIWGVQAAPSNRTVDNFIVKLRKKIEEDHKRPRHIMTVYGMGYKLVP
jgi:DNA-binding response OmpR family regulator